MKILESSCFACIKKATIYLFFSLGFFFAILIGLAFTDQPYWWLHKLGRENSAYKFKPRVLVLLGGGGMPSESNLIRAFYTNVLAEKYPESSVIIALPEDSLEDNSSLKNLRKYLIKGGLDSNRIFLENEGRNTRQQAVNIFKKWPQYQQVPLLLITSPEHMYRSIAVFKKVGFLQIGGEPCFEQALETELNFDDDQLGGNKLKIKVGHNQNLRYRFWNHLKYQLLFFREKIAYYYYLMRGWV